MYITVHVHINHNQMEIKKRATFTEYLTSILRIAKLTWFVVSLIAL